MSPMACKPPEPFALSRARLFAFLVLLNAVAPRTEAATVLVKQGAPDPAADGTTWATAFGSVQAGIDAAAAGDDVWVAAGIYREGIFLKPDVALYGGFSGVESRRTQRDWTQHASVIERDTNTSVPHWLLPLPRSVVMIAAGATPQTRIDGFTIRNGRAQYGAGIHVEGGSAVIANNTVVNNLASGVVGGGGVLFDVTRAPASLSAEAFFGAVSDRLLQSELGFGLANIPIHTNGSTRAGNGPIYSPRLHQLLQISANLWDATHTSPFPTVFRPQFEMRGDDVFVTNYVVEAGTQFLGRPWRSLDALADRAISPDDNVYGIPLVIGAKKGLPNFNEFVVQSAVQFSRKLEFRKNDAVDRFPMETNQMFIVGLSNSFGLEIWNSYSNAYPRALTLVFSNFGTATLTNDDGLALTHAFGTNATVNLPAATWAGKAFVVPPISVVTFLSNSVYRSALPGFERLTNTNSFEAGQGLYTNRWGLTVSHHLCCVLLDGDQVVDAVSLAGLDTYFDVSDALNKAAGGSAIANCWSIQPLPGALEGVVNQIDVSLGLIDSSADWNRYGALNRALGTNKEKAIAQFRAFMGFPPGSFPTNSLPPPAAVMQAPFIPTRKIYQTTTWQANDPLVHHLVDHLSDSPTNAGQIIIVVPAAASVPLVGPGAWLSNVNVRFNPWGGRSGQSASGVDYDSTIEDPGASNSDSWNFPSGPDLNLRWLDRIHRGTPWQTIYFDSAAAPLGAWRRQAGAAYSPDSHPTNDWRLVEQFLNGALLPTAFAPADPIMVNNTLAANTALGQGGGIFIVSNAAPVIANNIVAFGSSGIFNRSGAVPAARHNCVAGNSTYDYSGLPAGLNPVTALPLLVNSSGGDFRLLATSPGIDAGDDSAIALGWIERTGPTAPEGSHLDVGAHEFGPDGVPVLTGLSFLEPDGTVQVSLKGFPGQNYVVEASQDLIEWAVVGTNTAAPEGLLFIDSSSTNFSHRFYRGRTAN